jgi:antitoxin component YwqK of YwqJK toxin-antitoxin module
MDRIDIQDPAVGYEHHSGLTTFHGKPFTGEIVEYYRGEVTELTTYENGVRQGPRTSWYSGGQLAFEGEEYAGQPTGEWTTWYLNGQVKSIRYHEDDTYEIYEQTWAEDGTLLTDNRPGQE